MYFNLPPQTGHEDLRQDERVMQLFELVNTLLAANRETAKRQMAIQRYAIVPLSPRSGLIGWVCSFFFPLCHRWFLTLALPPAPAP